MIDMEKIADAAEHASVKAELNESTFLRYTNKGQNEVHVLTAKEAPNVMHEIGRLREEAFRAAGGGTGKALDIDQYDVSEFPYSQLIVWNPEEEEIMAGYRLLDCRELYAQGKGLGLLATSHLFEFSEKFQKDYFANTLELGRSFVQPKYQKGVLAKKGLFALDNLWDGLGGVIARNEGIDFLLGKVTMYPSFNLEARNAILAFLHVFFPDRNELATAIHPLITPTELKEWIDMYVGKSYKEAYVILNTYVRAREHNIPPLINSYMNLSSTMQTFGTSVNDEFGDVEETGILVTVSDIHESKQDRYFRTFERDCHYGVKHWE